MKTRWLKCKDSFEKLGPAWISQYIHRIFFLCFSLYGLPVKYIQDFVLLTRSMELCTHMCVSLLAGCVFLNGTSISFATVVMQFSLVTFVLCFHFNIRSSICGLLYHFVKIWLSLVLSNNLKSQTPACLFLYYHCSLWKSCLLDALQEALMWKLLQHSLFLFLLYIVWHRKCAVSCKVNRI